MLTMMDMAAGLNMEPPTACRARDPMSQPTLGAGAHSKEFSENSENPIWKTRLRPKQSASEPDSSSRRQAKVRL